MVTEIAEITVREGAEADFEAVMREKAVPILSSIPGVQRVRFGRGVEHPDKFAFVVEWDSVEAHSAAKALPAFGEFGGCFGDYAIGGAMQHFDLR